MKLLLASTSSIYGHSYLSYFKKTWTNHFKNIESYTLSKPLFNDKSVTEKVEVLEQLITLLTDCANRRTVTKKIEEVIDNLY